MSLALITFVFLLCNKSVVIFVIALNHVFFLLVVLHYWQKASFVQLLTTSGFGNWSTALIFLLCSSVWLVNFFFVIPLTEGSFYSCW